jgi:RNA polymerase sigma-70 factor (ECF subfamily)
VFRTLHRFHGRSSLRTWIFRIVVNQVRNRQRWWRRRARSRQVSLDQHVREHGEIALGADARTPDRELMRKELGARLKVALQHLPFEQRTALVLREVEGLRYEEIAFSLGLPVGTVKSRLTRARQALREELGDLRC